MLCVSIAEKDSSVIIDELKSVEFAEIRLDAANFSTDEVKSIFSTGKKLIATFRPNGSGDENRIAVLKAAVDAGAAYIDIGVENSDSFKQQIIPHCREKGCQVIISYHNYETTPQTREFDEVIRWCRESDPDIIKVAAKANTHHDAARILSLYRFDYPIVALGMGDFGKITRVASVMLGAPFTYVSRGEGKSTAPGQIDHERMKEILKLIEQD